MIKNKHLIILDFDGVLADSFDTFYLLIKAGMRQVGLSFRPDQYRDLFVGNVHQGFKDFINNKKKYLAFSEFRKTNYDKYYYAKNSQVKLFLGTSKFLKKIGKNYTLTIASSGREDNIKNLLKESGVKDIFGLILADSNYSKDTMIREILHKFHAKPKETFMISDTIGDIKIAKKFGLKTIAITWGFHSPELLRTTEPDYIIKNFKELQHLLK